MWSPRARLRGARGAVPKARRWACSSVGRALFPSRHSSGLGWADVKGLSLLRKRSRVRVPPGPFERTAPVGRGPMPCRLSLSLSRNPDHATRGRSAHFVRVSRVHTHDAGVQRSSPLPLPCPSPRMGRWTRVTWSARVQIPNCIPAVVEEQALGVGRIRSVNALEMRGLRVHNERRHSPAPRAHRRVPRVGPVPG